MKCGELHDNGCEEQLEESWTFCRSCGSRLIGFHWDPRHIVARRDGSVDLSASLVLDWPATSSATLSIEAGDLTLIEPKVSLVGKPNDRRAVAFALPGASNNAIVVATVADVRRSPDADSFVEGFAGVLRDPIRQALPVLRGTPQPVCLVLTPELLRGSSSKPKTVRVELEGASAIQLSPVVGPEGWIVSGLDGDVVRSNKPARFEFQAVHGSSKGIVSFGDSKSDVQVDLQLVPPMLATVKARPRFIVGIDFGTAGTSIAYRDLFATLGSGSKASETKFVGLQRGETLIFIPDPSRRSTWRWGEEAQIAKEEQSGFLIQELKKYLMQDDPTVPDVGLSAEELLAWYFEQIFHKVKRDLEAIAKASFGSFELEWRLSMPVIAGAQGERYRERLLKAGTTAKLARYGPVSVVFEPEAALMSIAASDVKALDGLRTGDRIMVVDSGAGTTDVCFGTVMRTDGTIGITAVSRYGIGLPKMRTLGVINGLNFGGGDVTRLAGSLAIDSWVSQAVPATNDEHVPEKVFQKAVTSLMNSRAAGVQVGDVDVTGFTPDRLTPFLPEVPPDQYWPAARPDLFRRFEQAKIELATKKLSEAVVSSSVGGAAKNVVGLSLRREAINSAAGAFQNDYADELRKTIDEESNRNRPLPSWIVYVGGNSCIEQFRTIAYLTTACEIEISDEARRLAIVRGLCSAEMAAPLFPFPVRVQVRTKADCWDLIAEYFPETITEQVEALKVYQFSDGTTDCVLTVESEFEGRWYVLRRIRLPDGLHFLPLYVTLTAGAVMAQIQSTSESPGLILLEDKI